MDNCARTSRLGIVALLFSVTLSLPQFARGGEFEDMSAAWSQAKKYYVKGDYANAVKYYEYALALADRVHGPNSAETGKLVNNVAVGYQELGQYAKAEPFFIRAVQIARATSDTEGVGFALNGLGVNYDFEGNTAQAERFYLEALKYDEASEGPNGSEVALVLNNLALLYVDQAEYGKADPLYQRALKIRIAKNGGGSAVVAETYTSMGMMYYEMAQYPLAISYYDAALKIREARLAPTHPRLANTLMDLGNAYRAQYEYEKAQPLLERALKIYEASLGPNHDTIARCVNNLGENARLMHKFPEAEAYYRRGLEIVEKNPNPNHPSIATALNNLGMLYRDENQDDKAEPLFLRAAKIYEAAFGPDSPDLAHYPLQELAMIHCAEGKWTAASDEIDRARRIVRRYVAHTLPVLSDRQQLLFLYHKDQTPFSSALTLGLVEREDQAIVDRSADWLINGKAVAQQSLAERTLLTRDSDDPAMADTVRQLNAVRNQLAQLSLRVAKPGKEAEHKAELNKLTVQERTLSGQLGEAVGRPTDADPWVELSKVRAAVPKDAVLIEIARFNRIDFKANPSTDFWLTPHYVAWLIPPDGASHVQIIDLGDAKEIDSLIQAAREAIEPTTKSTDAAPPTPATPTPPPPKPENAPHDSPKSTADHRGLELAPDVADKSQGAMRALSRRILQPIIEHIGNAEQIIVSPDASLWLVPWGALPLADGKFAIEKYKIRYVISGRDLVTQSTGQIKLTAPVVFANPDYDLDPAEAAEATAAVLRGGAAAQAGPLHLAASSGRLPNVGRLPGTAAEAEAIMPKLKEYAGADPVAYMDRYALEGVFKALHRPRVVVLSTHGFLLPDQPLAPQTNSTAPAAADRSGVTSDRIAFVNPLLRCGLLLAGCNRQPESGTVATGDDGILTGLEIVGTDLRGTDLVVLSACETGLGDVGYGEGVRGLRQAFQLAGANAVVATLWQIPDRETSLLVSDFFANLSAGQTKPDALRNAQLSRIAAHRKTNAAANPYYWAAFTLTGE